MAKGTSLELNLTPPSAVDLFSSQSDRDNAALEKVHTIPLAEIDDFPDHPFHVAMDEAMNKMVESVKEYGVLNPAIARQKEDGRYELVSGHRRRRACELAGVDTLPVIVREMSRDEAIIYMVDSNLQRERILPSEKAKAYKMKLEAIKRQGQRTDLTSTPVVSKLRTNENVGKDHGESREQVRRFIRLTELAPEIMQMVDDNRIAFRPAVELSYLPQEQQQVLLEAMELEDRTPSLAQAIKLKQFAQENRLNNDVILSIMQENKPNQRETVKIPRDRLSKYFKAGTPAKQIEDDIVKGLELLHRQRSRSGDAR